jgi:hypothetical protein
MRRRERARTARRVQAGENPHADVENTCVGCHVNGNNGVDHTFVIRDWEGCEAEGCHTDDMTDGGQAAEDYDGDGQTETFGAEIEGLLESLEQAVNNAAGSTSFGSQQGNIVFEGADDVQGTDPAYQAAYNYLYVEKDGSRGMHNPQFTIQLLQDSIAAVSQ